MQTVKELQIPGDFVPETPNDSQILNPLDTNTRRRPSQR